MDVFDRNPIEHLTPTSGEPSVDAHIARELGWLMKRTGLTPSIRFASGRNARSVAIAARAGTLRPGAIYLDRDLLRRIANDAQAGWPSFVGLTAHEFAHLLQFVRNSNILPREIAKTCELHADFLAGYFMGTHPELSTPELINGFIKTAAERASNSHGTAEQRRAAILSGFFTSSEEPEDAFVIGERVISQLVDVDENTSNVRRLVAADDQAGARAALQTVSAASMWAVRANQPVVRVRHTYRNGGDKDVIVKLISVVVVNEGTESKLLSTRTQQHLIMPGERAFFDVLSSSFTGHGVESTESRVSLIVAFRESVI